MEQFMKAEKTVRVLYRSELSMDTYIILYCEVDGVEWGQTIPKAVDGTTLMGFEIGLELPEPAENE
jgi:hypothetical protein